MLSVSEKLRTLINADSRTFKARLKNGSNVYEQIVSLKKAVTLPSSTMSIGNALCACLECTASDIPDSIFGVKFEAEITIYESDEWIKLGTFTSKKPESSKRNVTFEAYDAMERASNVTYKSKLSKGIHTAEEYFEDICDVLNESFVELDKESSELEIVEDKLSGYSCRDALAYLAGFLGKNCIVNRDGCFEMVSFKLINYDMLNVDRIAEPEFGDSNSIVSYIACCIDEETTLISGEGSSGFEFISPLMTQDRLDYIHSSLFNNSSPVSQYKPGRITQMLGDPTLDICDVVTLSYEGKSHIVPIMSLVFDFDGGLLTEIESFDLSEPNSLSLVERLSFGQKQAKEKTEGYVNAMIEFSQAIQKAYGVSNTVIDGITYFHDSEDINSAKYIFCITEKGIAFSNSWGGSHQNTVWKYGISKDGEAVLNMLNVFHIKADLIESGMLKSVDGNMCFDLNAGVHVTRITEKDENDEIVEKYVYQQDADGVFLKTGITLNFQEFLNSLSEAEKQEIAEKTKNHFGDPSSYSNPITAAAIAMANKTYDLYYKTKLLKTKNKGFFIECIDEEITYQYLFSGNKTILLKIEDGEINQLEQSVNGVKSSNRYRIDAPGVDLPVTILTSDDDCDSLINEGKYLYQTANRPTNAPFDNAAIIEIVGTDSPDSQKIMRATRYGDFGYSKWRNFHGGKWGTWCEYWGGIEDPKYAGCYYRKQNGTTEWINPPMIADVEYRTVERYEGKVVYVKNVNFGALPNAGTKTVTTGINGKYAFDMRFDIHMSNGSLTTFPYISTGFEALSRAYLESDGDLIVRTNSDLSAYNAKVLIKYTKS